MCSSCYPRVTGGELFEDIVAREYYSEADARYVACSEQDKAHSSITDTCSITHVEMWVHHDPAVMRISYPHLGFSLRWALRRGRFSPLKIFRMTFKKRKNHRAVLNLIFNQFPLELPCCDGLIATVTVGCEWNQEFLSPGEVPQCSTGLVSKEKEIADSLSGLFMVYANSNISM